MVALRTIGYVFTILMAALVLGRQFLDSPGVERRIDQLEARLKTIEQPVPSHDEQEMLREIASMQEIVDRLSNQLDRLSNRRVAKKPESRSGGKRVPSPSDAAPEYGTEEFVNEMRDIVRAGREAQVRWLAKRFGLDKATQEEIASVLDNELARSQTAHDRVKRRELPVRALATELRRIQSERDYELRRLFTEEQFLEYKKLFPDRPTFPVVDEEE